MSQKKKTKRLRKLFAGWIEFLRTTHAATTLETWENYVSAHFVPFFEDVDGITRKRCAAYLKERLGQVTIATVKKERTALRSFIEWALVNDELDAPEWADERPNDPSLAEAWAQEVVNAMVPRPPKRARGVPYHQRRRVAAFELSPEQVKAIIRALPEWSSSTKVDRFPIRARFVVAYETSLRPSTLDRIECPKHYQPGSKRLQLTPDTDKARFGREVPLTKRARRVLDYLLRALGPGYAGLIFGAHDYRTHIRAAAAKALPAELALRFAGAHLRSARITHLLERPKATLPGTQFLAGHKQGQHHRALRETKLQSGARDARGDGGVSKRRPHPLRRHLRELADCLPRMNAFARNFAITIAQGDVHVARAWTSTSWVDKGRIHPPVRVPRSLRRYFGAVLR